MGESYVRPVTGAREPRRTWIAVWRFRLATLVLCAGLGVATVWGLNKVIHLGDQDPTSDIQAPTPSP